MKLITFLTVLFLTYSVHAATASECANNIGDKANIAGLLSLINPWGQWEGTADGKKVVIQLSLPASGKFTGVASFDGRVIGPYNVKVCDYGNEFSLVLLGFEVEFEVISSRKIRVLKQVGSSPSVVLTKTSSKIKTPLKATPVTTAKH